MWATQPICPYCFAARFPDLRPSRVLDAEPETCCDCGSLTAHGIYARVDLATVRFPKGSA
jgi:hypothetical protein